MKAKEIQELLDFIANSGLDEVNVETEAFKISVKKNSGVVRLVEPTVIPSMPIAAAPGFAAPPVAAPPPANPALAVESKSSADSSNLVTVKSPMIGTFYRSSNPETPPFVNVGDSIKKGKTICIIEAMKLFNEIESEISGKIVKVLVENASPVEYDQPLFLVQPE
jgi:acetyl-CoA carboxylase biotin carboxyl carrier protein